VAEAPPPTPDHDRTLRRVLLTLADQKAEEAQGVTIHAESVGDLNTFLFKNLPYRNVVASNLTQGLIEVEDMNIFEAKQPINWQLPYWSFGSKYYRIDRAVRVNYRYAYPQPGEPPLQGSLFFGFQSNGTTPSPDRLQAAERTATTIANPMIQAACDALNSAGLKGAIRAHEAGGDALPPLEVVLNTLSASTNPGVNTTQFNTTIHEFDEFVVAMEPNGPGPLPETLSSWQMQFVPKRRFTFGDQIAYCGIAAANNQAEPFMYNLPELVAANKLDDLIAWHFGSTGFRVTKAMRLTYTCSWDPVTDSTGKAVPGLEREGNTSGTLLIGYTGPHPS
jgi:hypothetical protein